MCVKSKTEDYPKSLFIVIIKFKNWLVQLWVLADILKLCNHGVLCVALMIGISQLSKDENQVSIMCVLKCQVLNLLLMSERDPFLFIFNFVQSCLQ